MTTPEAAARRVKRYLAERARMSGYDKTSVHGLNMGTEREVELLVADLRTLLDHLPAAIQNNLRRLERDK